MVSGFGSPLYSLLLSCGNGYHLVSFCSIKFRRLRLHEGRPIGRAVDSAMTQRSPTCISARLPEHSRSSFPGRNTHSRWVGMVPQSANAGWPCGLATVLEYGGPFLPQQTPNSRHKPPLHDTLPNHEGNSSFIFDSIQVFRNNWYSMVSLILIKSSVHRSLSMSIYCMTCFVAWKFLVLYLPFCLECYNGHNFTPAKRDESFSAMFTEPQRSSTSSLVMK